MRTVANIGPAILAGAALLLAASLPAMPQASNDERCLSIEDTDRRVDCLEGTPESAETTPAPEALPAPPTSLIPNSKAPASKTSAVKPQSRERFSASFNCAKAATSIQKAICGDATLAEWDSRMGELFRQASAQQGKNKTLAGEQRQWLSRRDSTCKSPEAAELNSCVLEMTKTRLAELATTMAAKEPAPAPAPATASDQEQPAPTASKALDCSNPKNAAACREAKRKQDTRDKEPPSAAARAPATVTECPEGTIKSGRTRSGKVDCKVQVSAKERGDFRRILLEDKEVRESESTRSEQQSAASEQQQRPYEIDVDTKLESADARLGYTTISSTDFFRDSRELAKSRKKIALDGAYLKIGNDERFYDSRMTALLARSGHSTDPGIALVTDQAPGDLRAYFSSCSGFSADVDISCSARIRGHVTICKQTGPVEVPCLAVEDGAALK